MNTSAYSSLLASDYSNFVISVNPKILKLHALGFNQKGTRVRFLSAKSATVIAPVSYSDIGGLDAQVQAIRRMVEVPLLSRERFLRMDIKKLLAGLI